MPNLTIVKDVSCNNDYEGAPAYMVVSISEEQLSQIKYCHTLLNENNFMEAVTLGADVHFFNSEIDEAILEQMSGEGILAALDADEALSRYDDVRYEEMRVSKVCITVKGMNKYTGSVYSGSVWGIDDYIYRTLSENVTVFYLGE